MGVCGAQYGNLLSYKFRTRPAARKEYGTSEQSVIKKQAIAQKILRVLFLHGPCTTWDMAKAGLDRTGLLPVRTLENKCRRCLLGRSDTKNPTCCLLDLGLVIGNVRGTSTTYRLSIHGILYCLDVMDITDGEVDAMASRYADVCPRVFGRWSQLGSALGGGVYTLRTAAKGIFLDDPPPDADSSASPIRELMEFVHMKYHKNFDCITEPDLAEQISYWFYTSLLPHAGNPGINALAGVLKDDVELGCWYAGFFNEAAGYYQKRHLAMRDLSALLPANHRMPVNETC